MPLVKVFLTINILCWIVMTSFIFKASAMTSKADSGKKLVALIEMLLLDSRLGTQTSDAVVLWLIQQLEIMLYERTTFYQ